MKSFVSHMMLLHLFVFCCLVGLTTIGFAFPSQMTYQGEIPGGFTGLATTYFSIINIPDPGTPTINYWTNDASSPAAGNVPFHGVTTYVNNGKYSLDLGDTHYANMTSLWSSVFVQDQLYLRVWYRAGGPLTRIYPDQRLVCEPFAYNAMRLNGNVAGNNSGNIPISNATMNAGLNADLLDGLHGSSYRNASNLNAGIVPAARLSGSYSSATVGGSDTLDGYHAGDFLKTTGGYYSGTLNGTTNSNWSLYAINNSGDKSTIYAINYGPWKAFSGVKYGDIDVAAVNCINNGAHGSGVYGYTASTSYGVYGVNDGTGPGVYGFSKNGVGVYGDGSTFGLIGLGNSIGVYGNGNFGVYAVGSDGVYTVGSLSGVLAFGNDYGVYGSASCGVLGLSDETNGYGVYAKNNNHGYGLYAYSSTYRGAYIGNGFPNSWITLYVEGRENVTGDMSIGGDLFVTGSKAGYVVDYCKNSGTGTLEVGDIVVIQGSAPAIFGQIPLMLVSKASTAYNTAVVGVVNKSISVTTSTNISQGSASAQSETELNIHGNDAALIQPNEYVSVVTLGAYKSIKVDASYGAIQPGDLLTTSATPGYAMKAQPELINGKPFYPSGCIIGKSLGTLAAGQGTVPVSVSRQ